MKTLFSAALIGLVMLPAAARAQVATPNFTGKWSIDIAKSDFGPMPPPESVVHVIEHKEPNIKIVTTQKGPQGESTNERALTTDGKENLNKMRIAGGESQEIKSTSRWNGKAFTTAFKLVIQGSSFDVNDAWTISDDGKVLTIVRDIKSDQGAFSTTTVFNKQ